jgi:hypothetical protein
VLARGDAEHLTYLLEEAAVPASRRGEAEAWLRWQLPWLRSARNWTAKLPSKAQRRKLDRLAALAGKTRTTLDEICREPGFGWYANFFLHFRRAVVNVALQGLRDGVAATKLESNRPRDARLYSACGVALRFFELFSPIKPSNGGHFENFCTRLCGITLGTPKDVAPSAVIRALLREAKRARRGDPVIWS